MHTSRTGCPKDTASIRRHWKRSGVGARLVVTVDCGISAFREAEAAARARAGPDHNRPPRNRTRPRSGPHGSEPLRTFVLPREFILPDAYAILHPGLLLPGLPDRIREQVSGLTGVGIAFKLAQALLGVEPVMSG